MLRTAALRTEPLPVPRRIRAELQELLAGLDELGEELVQVLALLDRPCSSGLLAACSSSSFSISPFSTMVSTSFAAAAAAATAWPCSSSTCSPFSASS